MGIIYSANCSLQLQMSRESPSYVAAQPLSLLLPPPSPLWVSMLQMKIIHFPCTILTGAATRDRLGAAWSPLIFLSTKLIIVQKLHPPSHYLNWKLIIFLFLFCKCGEMLFTQVHLRRVNNVWWGEAKMVNKVLQGNISWFHLTLLWHLKLLITSTENAKCIYIWDEI